MRDRPALTIDADHDTFTTYDFLVLLSLWMNVDVGPTTPHQHSSRHRAIPTEKRVKTVNTNHILLNRSWSYPEPSGWVW